MSEVKWTDEQQSAIETRNCNLLVAAAAGSGKTAVLVERIIRMITDKEKPVDIDKLLVVTFTNAAASEMRGKIAAAITKELEKNPREKEEIIPESLRKLYEVMRNSAHGMPEEDAKLYNKFFEEIDFRKLEE